MTMFDRPVEDVESRLGVGGKFPSTLAVGRWVTPVLLGLGALALGGYLLIADLDTLVAKSLAPVSAVQIASSTPVPAPLAHSSDTAIVFHSSPARDESMRTSTLDLLKAVCGAVIALALTMIGAWLGVRRARALDAGEGTLARAASDRPVVRMG